MKTIHSFAELQQIQEPIVCVLGTFDGLHKGHQFLIDTAVTHAQAVGAKTMVATFDCHPRHFLGKAEDVPLLMSHEQRLATFGKHGIDYLLLFHVSKEFLSMPALQFANALLEDTPIVDVFIGENFTFGQYGKGRPELLVEVAHPEKTVIHVLALQQASDVISSTRIRRHIQNGEMELVTDLLGHPFGFQGEVVYGDQRGRTLGFPTANFNMPAGLVVPRDGVYIMRVKIDDTWYEGIGNVGNNPTFEKQLHRVEVHIFNFDKDIYGKSVYVEFLKFLRGEEKFTSLAALISQMQEDTRLAKEYFASKGASML